VSRILRQHAGLKKQHGVSRPNDFFTNQV